MPSSGEGLPMFTQLAPITVVGLVGMGLSLMTVGAVLFSRRKIEQRPFWATLVLALFAFVGFSVLAVSPKVDVITKISSSGEDSG